MFGAPIGPWAKVTLPATAVLAAVALTSCSSNSNTSSSSSASSTGAASKAATPAAGGSNSAAQPQLKVFAQGTETMSQPDNITILDGNLFVGFQNGIHAKGQPGPSGNADSTLVEYDMSGKEIAHWDLKGHLDGMRADPANHRVITTANEDANSHMFTITNPGPNAGEVKEYHYDLNPLPSGGGTDDVEIYNGKLLISASSPTVKDGPAVYQVDLTGDTAKLSPFFMDDSTATVANTDAPDHGQTVTLALTDPDSNEVVPPEAPRFAGDFVLDSQGDGEQIYADQTGNEPPKLEVLRLSTHINDTAWATSNKGTLYITDTKHNKIYTLSGDFTPGTTFVAATPHGETGYLGTLDMNTGKVTSYNTDMEPSGLLFIPAS